LRGKASVGVERLANGPGLTGAARASARAAPRRCRGKWAGLGIRPIEDFSFFILFSFMFAFLSPFQNLPFKS
jgi:hypothetical protein